MAEEAVPKKTRIFCNTCRQETNHSLNGEHVTKWYDQESDFGEILKYRLWICMGCERGVLQQEYSNSETGYGEEAGTDISYFPQRSPFELFAKPPTKVK